MPAEAQIEKRVVAWCKDHGIYTRKFTSPAHRGVPDRIFIYRGVTAFVEFKQPGKKPSGLQTRELMALERHGIPAGWFSDSTLATTWLLMVLKCD